MTLATKQLEFAASKVAEIGEPAKCIIDALIVAVLEHEKRLHDLEKPEPPRDDPEEDRRDYDDCR